MSTTTTPDRPKKTNDSKDSSGSSDMMMDRPGADQYYTELIRIVTGLFVGILALMTFLLTVGFQRPHTNFAYALYASLVLLALNLVAYVFGHLFRAQCKEPYWALASALDETKDGKIDKDDQVLASLRTNLGRARKRLKVMRFIQQILFILAIVAVTFLAFATAGFFFAINPAAGGAAPQ